MAAGDQSLAQELRDHEREIRKDWAANLIKRIPRARADDPRAVAMGADGTDLLNLLQAQLEASDRSARAQVVKPLVERVRLPNYSICDLYHEVDSLKDAIETVLGRHHRHSGRPVEHILIQAYRTLDGLFDGCLTDTSLIYETVLEGSARGYCQVDRRGIIHYANPAMNSLLRTDDCRGLRLKDFFGKQGRFVRQALTGRRDNNPVLRRMFMRLADDTVPVSAEFGPLLFDGKVTGGYAVVVDISRFVKAEQKAYEASQLGIVKMDTDLRITFVNDKAVEILGIAREEKATLVGRRILDLFDDDESRRTIKQNLKLRHEGRGSEYTVYYRRPSDGRTVPILINGMPEFDNLNELTGYFGIFQSLEFERARAAIHELTESIVEPDRLLDSLFKVIGDVIDFKFATVAVYTEDMAYARVVHFFPKPEPMWETQWFPISDDLKKWITGKQTWGRDIEAFVKDQPGTEDIATDPVIRRLPKEGYRSFVCLPIRQAERVIAVVTLFTKQYDSYDGRHRKLMENELPIEKAVCVALYGRERIEQAFLHKLLKQLAGCSHSEDVATGLVEELCRFYRWQNVAIFKVNTVRGQFELLAQAAGAEGGYTLPRDFRQPIDTGILGWVSRECKPVNVGDVKGNHELAKYFLSSNPKTNSELCLPIRVMGKIRWLLNVEDSRRNAFGGPEIQILQRVIGEIESTLEGLFHRITFEEIFAVATNGVVITDTEGVIIRCNRPAAGMLQISAQEAEGQKIQSFIGDEKSRKRIASDNQIHALKVELRGRDNKTTVALVNGSVLPDEYDTKVLFLQDIGALEWQHESRAIGAALSEVAAQTRVPLSLAASLVRRVGRAVGEGELSELIDNAIRQIGKVEMTYDRVLAARHPEALPKLRPVDVDVGRIVEAASRELPAEELEDIDVEREPGLPTVRCDAFQLAFVVRSILGYLLRIKPLDARIKVRVRRTQDMVTVSITGPGPAEPRPDAADFLTEAEEQARASVSLGEPLIETIIEKNHRGSYRRTSANGGLTTFAFTLPAVR